MRYWRVDSPDSFKSWYYIIDGDIEDVIREHIRTVYNREVIEYMPSGIIGWDNCYEIICEAKCMLGMIRLVTEMTKEEYIEEALLNG